MTKTTSSFFFIFLFLSPIFLSAQKPLKDPSGFKKQFAETSSNTNSIESDFLQEKHLTMMSETIKTKGKFYFRKENKLRWEYTSPFKYLVILNNGKAYIKDENKQNKFDIQSNKMFGEINTILMGSVQGTLLKDEKNFTATYFETKDAWIVRLKPRASRLSSFLSEIVITFDKINCSVTRLEMLEPAGDFTVINFTSKKTNTLTNDEKFLIP
ncbi:MAG: outer membrane lipoprotein carrier protein LolA [Syntrophothermus sp.]